MAYPEPPDIVIKRLLDRILDGVVVPFLGAGVSGGAGSRSRDASDTGPTTCAGSYVPKVAKMIQRLAWSLLDDIKAPGSDAAALRTLLFSWPPAQLPPWASGSIAPAEPAARCPHTLEQVITLAQAIARSPDDQQLVAYLEKLSGGRLDRWTEAHVAKRGWAATMEVLRIDRFADLEPQPAHVYLGYLAREGLVTEVVTSNYDTCLELALARTLMEHERQPESLPLKVVCDLDGYRRDGASSHAGPARRLVLHVYKINGCARRYRQQLIHPLHLPSVNSAAERIVLTERQLQTFRSEGWAEDLLRDRSRCRALLFCGFGSDEPQVRHTLLAVAREFTAGGGGDDGKCWELPNAPFMVLYEQVLSFTQYQVMRGYADAHGAKFNASLTEPLSNVIGGLDASWFGATATLPADFRLPADNFWKGVFQAAFLRLVDRAAGPSGVLRRWLSAQRVPAPSAVADVLRTWLGAAGSGPLSQGTWRGRRSVLLEPSHEAGALLGDAAKNAYEAVAVLPLVLSLWLLSVQGLIDRWLGSPRPDRSGADQDTAGPGHPYFPLREDPLLVLTTLLIVALLLGDECDADSLASCAPGCALPHCVWSDNVRVRATRGLGLQIKTDDGRSVYLVADNYVGSPDVLEEQPGEVAQAILQIVIPTHDEMPSDARLIFGSTEPGDVDGSGSNPWVRAARVERIAAPTWLAARRALTRHELIRQWATHPPRPTRAIVEDL
jgi:hypothetical protein